MDIWMVSTFVVILFTFLLGQLLILERKRKRLSRQIPCRKLRFLNILGDLCILPTKRFLQMGYSQNIALLQTLSGYSRLFCKEKMFLFWLSYIPFVVGAKAEVIEDMIGGTKMMKKNWSYSFLHVWLGTGLLTSHGGKWKSRRKLITPSFHFEILKDFLPVFNKKSAILVSLMKEEVDKEFTDIVLPITLCSLDIICETTLGVSIEAQNNKDSPYVTSIGVVSDIMYERMFSYKYWIDCIFWLLKPGRELKKHLKVLHDFTNSVIREKKRHLADSSVAKGGRRRMALMDLLLEHHLRTKTLTEEDIREEVDTFAFEGHDTTSMGMTWALYLIGLHKEVQNKVHEEIDFVFGNDMGRPVTTDDIKDMPYLDCVLKECQRLYPSVPIIAREVDKEVTVCGKVLPPGTTCVQMIYALHRDEEVFPDPEKFDPDRFLPENTLHRHPYAYIPFSAGPRNCIGQRFALLEEKVVLCNFLRHYTLESLDPRDKVVTTPDLVLRPSVPIRIKIRQRSPNTN